MRGVIIIYFFFFFNDTATTEIYTLSLHDALPIWNPPKMWLTGCRDVEGPSIGPDIRSATPAEDSSARLLVYGRSEEHTSELQSRQYLVCRLLLEKKNKKIFSVYNQIVNKRYLHLK